jgi:putative ABC transport system permease protein
MRGIGQEIRYALRAWTKTPAVAAAAVLTLGLAIGANTALFSLVDSLLFKTLPVRNPEQLVMVKGGPATLASEFFTYVIWDQFDQRQQELPNFDGMFAWAPSRFNLKTSGEVDDVEGFWVTGKFFETLGVSPALGRMLMPADDQPNGGPDGPAAVITYQFWQTRFSGARDVIGRPLPVEGVAYTIVGVTPSNFFGPVVGSTFDVALPIQTERLIKGRSTFLTSPNSRAVWFSVMGRLKPRGSIEGATADLRAVQPRIRDMVRPAGATESYLAKPFTLVPAASGVEFPAPAGLRGRYRLPLLILLAAAGSLLLIGCANIANLLLARAASRSHELTVRLALGASRWRLARESFIETSLLAGAGTVVGLLMGRWGGRFLVQQLGPSVLGGRAHLELSLDWRMLTFTASVMTMTTLLCGMSAAFGTSELRPIDTMKTRNGRLSRSTHRYTGALVVFQIALSFVLVVIAGLFTSTFARLMTADLGFDHGEVLLIGVNPQNTGTDRTARISLFERVHEAVLSVPGVESAAISNLTPFAGRRFGVGFQVPGRAGDVNGNGYFVSTGWFSTYRMTLLAGRDFNSQDRPGAPRALIVNQSFVRSYLDGTNPVGRTIDYVDRKFRVQYEIVGVVTDSAYNSIRETASPPPTYYLPLDQYDVRTFPGPDDITITVRPTGESGAPLVRNLTAAVMKVNPNLSLTVRTLSDQVALSVSQERLLAILGSFFGALALSLAAVGLYGVTAYAVNLRRAEMGIRIALGSEPRRLVWMILRQVGKLIFAGVAIGTLLSWWSTRFINTSLLFGLQPHDRPTLLAAIVVLTSVGMLSGWIPSRRAARVDPLVALRYE